MNLSVCAICGALECACAEQEIADRVRAEEEAQIDIFEESEDEGN